MKRNENAFGARIEAPKWVCGGVSPYLVGEGFEEGTVPPPQNFFLIFCLAMVHSGHLF